MVPGGPMSDWPRSASRIPTLTPEFKAMLANMVQKPVLPVSTLPMTTVLPCPYSTIVCAVSLQDSGIALPAISRDSAELEREQWMVEFSDVSIGSCFPSLTTISCPLSSEEAKMLASPSTSLIEAGPESSRVLPALIEIRLLEDE